MDRGPPMEGEEASRIGCIRSRRSRSFSGLFCCNAGISQGPRRRIGEVEDEEGKESVEGEESEETEGRAALAGAPVASEAPNLALAKQPLVSEA
ncbi:hypothetical protein O181_038624 [Austropuccinia psidii MF-1]|uniref:Uncharacterized protein n=1 Tax=Austropuccinia psidii MF-1 TaxID=1389203 RepID=A0A9Q3HDR1_9BASI|nr:hypothetical protein [Austropuccinia psidii MF-1]